ncbi:hypothetical protein P170DRAFT_512269 [Aspergillus steynii IBT 23096]|uniref:Alpha-ketoglutarate-dependent sulfonate dioxygenase n=1 Tax=Aspergillus steynii IBT 23096 TaxID=1392250 RepID=A0A2I2FYA2_9EURO|nr:uncharacterized protein P170DRAFT_512269 [Aspergillus steynii IBT 23096]PLB45609.1 hypothetical protein P170DRAFT_512269 [Aspergillus steynii IBT 23096]
MEKSVDDNPPPYDQIDQQPEVDIPPLNLASNAGPASYTTVTQDECVAHLKFLAALADLRDSTAGLRGLFCIHDPSPSVFEQLIDEARARVKEKRWAVYTARAVERYTVWWETCIPFTDPPIQVKDFESKSYNAITENHKRLVWSPETLPPLDVLMVWHAHMLNPRAFLEDCIRAGKMSLWATGFPWEAINACIGNKNFEYDPGIKAKATFTAKTGFAWDNLQNSSKTLVRCPGCTSRVSVLWTDGVVTGPLGKIFEDWKGFADKGFKTTCPKCTLTIDHEKLRIEKFREDVNNLATEDLPMPGTLFNNRGHPEAIKYKTSRRQTQWCFPNRLVKAASRELQWYLNANQMQCDSLRSLRDKLVSMLNNKDIMRNVNSHRLLLPIEKMAFRRMMSCYWDNHGPFALDLVGAVIRQGTFVQKMDGIDWLHSPTVKATMGRLIKKYSVFFRIMAANPKHMAVPTLDVDLAWHTHQLSPSRYYTYSLLTTNDQRRYPVFIDHDDKVDEEKLSDGFEWTSKTYKKLTGGEIYSECTCWYCEAVRAPDMRDGLFVTSATSRAREAAAQLHDRPDISSHPDKNPHISTHNAVRPTTLLNAVDSRQVKYLKLRSNYEKARRRAEKRESKEGKKREKRASDDSLAYVPYVWGFPVMVPYYAPYECDPSVHSEAYVGDPSCMSTVPGAMDKLKTSLQSTLDSAKEKLGGDQAIDNAKDQANDYYNKGKDQASSAADKAKEQAEKALGSGNGDNK